MRPFAVPPSKRKSSECLYAEQPPKQLIAAKPSNPPNTRALTSLPAGYLYQHTKKTPKKRTTNTTTSANLTEQETEPLQAPCGASSSEPRALGAARPTGATA
ncbi:uncharacterized protein EKO05_0002525 [Ascochyta rabiei]|uniref:uncharacterized protein n=1 Tax=Didymella rabiei TaxID=5454 RepID=UPI00220CD38C|nr:uncharacterized protein EKO05_0002525 [Ascochyta rabiei]UPX11942.1 hypothetical protein EKO05_0002525 [Ascochyta rabiei]